jgi:hypothetical protein
MASTVCHKIIYTLECAAYSIDDQYVICAQGWTVMFRTLRRTPQCNLPDRQCEHYQHQHPVRKAVARTYHNRTLHITLLQRGPTSFRNCASIFLLLNRNVRDILQQNHPTPAPVHTVYGMLGVVLIYRCWFVDINPGVFVYSWLAPHSIVCDTGRSMECRHVCVCVCVYVCRYVRTYVCR